MKVKEYFYNVQCDCCGELASETWWVDQDQANTVADGSEYLEMGGRDYCPNCRYYDDDDILCTKDGRRWDENTHEEIDNTMEDDEEKKK